MIGRLLRTLPLVVLAVVGLDLVGVAATPEPPPRWFTAAYIVGTGVGAIVIGRMQRMVQRERDRASHAQQLLRIRAKRTYPAASAGRYSSPE